MLNKMRKLIRNRSGLWEARRYASLCASNYGEDVLIERLLRPGSEGVYVDVGASRPISSSNTYRLYLKGWHGLTIDPNPAFVADWRRVRPGDKHLTQGVSPEPGTLTYFEFAADQLNTLSPQRAADLALKGHQLLRERKVKTEPLADIIDRELGNAHVDLLNVDVEGLDREVLESIDLSVRRPSVMIVEDYENYQSFLKGEAPTSFGRFIRANGYQPIAQSAWSCILVAEDWRDLFRRSMAFEESRVQNSYMPGQYEELPWVGSAAAGSPQAN